MERETAAMEWWIEMAAMVSRQTLIHFYMMTTVVQAIDIAHRKFTVIADALGRGRTGLPVGDRDAFPFGVSASVFLEIAVREITRFNGLHAGVAHVFGFCAELIGLRGNALRWQCWEGHRADVVTHANMALRWLLSAASHRQAAKDVVRVYSALQPGSSLWIEWVSAAEQHLRRAADEVAMARDAVERIRPAIVLEFSDAWMLLYH